MIDFMKLLSFLLLITVPQVGLNLYSHECSGNYYGIGVLVGLVWSAWADCSRNKKLRKLLKTLDAIYEIKKECSINEKA